MSVLPILIISLIGVVIGTAFVLYGLVLPGVCILAVSGLPALCSIFILTFRRWLPQEWLC